MADLNLAPNISIANATKIKVIDAKEERTDPNDPDTVNELHTIVELRSAQSTNRFYGRHTIRTRNFSAGPPAIGQSDRLRVRPTTPGDPEEFVAGMSNEAVLHLQRDVLSLPTGFTTAFAAWRNGGVNGRKGALLTELIALGQITVPGTVS